MDIIPNRKEFKRADVEKVTSLSGKVLDYWESEFEVFFPKKNNGEKIYLYKDVQIILKLKQYLTVDRLNKAEIKEKLSGNQSFILKNIEKKTDIQEKKEQNKTEIIKKKVIKTVERSQNIKQNIIVEEQKKKKKQIINKNDNLNLLKEDLHAILTILKKNDKNTI